MTDARDTAGAGVALVFGMHLLLLLLGFAFTVAAGGLGYRLNWLWIGSLPQSLHQALNLAAYVGW